MSTKEQATLPAEDLAHLLSLNQLVLGMIMGMRTHFDGLMQTYLKDIIDPEVVSYAKKSIEDFDKLQVAHLGHDLMRKMDEILRYLPEFKSSSIVELETLQ